VLGSVDVVLLSPATSSSFSNDKDGERVTAEGCEGVLRVKILNIPALVNEDGAAGSPLLSTCLQRQIYHQYTIPLKKRAGSN